MLIGPRTRAEARYVLVPAGADDWVVYDRFTGQAALPPRDQDAVVRLRIVLEDDWLAMRLRWIHQEWTPC